MRKLYPFIFCLSLMACNQQPQNTDYVEIQKQLNKNNNQVTVVLDVSYSLNKEEIESFITEEHAPFFFSLGGREPSFGGQACLVADSNLRLLYKDF